MTYMYVVRHILLATPFRSTMQQHRKSVRILPVATGLLLLLMLGANLTAVAAEKGKQWYLWRDADGNPYYSQQVPPEASKYKRTIINERGLRVKTLEAAKTKEEIEEEKRQAQLRAEEERIAREKAAYDRKLLTTYDSEEGLVRARDSKITYVENDINSNKLTLKQQQDTLANYRQSAANYERSGKEVPEKVLNNIQDLRKQIEKTEQYIADRRIEQKQIRADFETEIQRYRQIIKEREERSNP